MLTWVLLVVGVVLAAVATWVVVSVVKNRRFFEFHRAWLDHSLPIPFQLAERNALYRGWRREARRGVTAHDFLGPFGRQLAAPTATGILQHIGIPSQRWDGIIRAREEGIVIVGVHTVTTREGPGRVTEDREENAIYLTPWEAVEGATEETGGTLWIKTAVGMDLILKEFERGPGEWVAALREHGIALTVRRGDED